MESGRGPRGRSLRVGREEHLHQEPAVLRVYIRRTFHKEHRQGVRPRQTGRFHNHRPHLPRWIVPGILRCGKVPDLPGGGAQGLQLLRIQEGQPRGHGKGNIRQHQAEEHAHTRSGGQFLPVQAGDEAGYHLRSIQEIHRGQIPADRSGREGVRDRQLQGLGGQGSVPAGCKSGDSGILRKDPQVQPRGHGHSAPAVPGRTERRIPRTRRKRDLRHRAGGSGAEVYRQGHGVQERKEAGIRDPVQGGCARRTGLHQERRDTADRAQEHDLTGPGAWPPIRKQILLSKNQIGGINGPLG